MRAVWILAGMLAFAGHAQAQEAQTCSAIAPPPAGFSHWSHSAPLATASTPALAQNRSLPVGQARKLALTPASAVDYAAAPERPDTEGARAGMVVFDVARDGVYRVGLSAGAWIEVVQDGKTLKSAAHGHGPECSGIRKIVDFSLQRGRYILQLSGSMAGEVTAMIVPAPPGAGHAAH